MKVMSMQKELNHPNNNTPGSQLRRQLQASDPQSAISSNGGSPFSDSNAASPVYEDPHAGDSRNTPGGVGMAYGDGPLEQERRLSKLPPMGDEVLLEFGRPPLREALRQWSEGFGKRACIYVCGPSQMKVDVANAVAEMQDDIWISDEREEVYLHTESFGW